MRRTTDAKAALLRTLNRQILVLADRSPHGARARWEFFCECGRADCHKELPLSANEYTAVIENDGALFAPGHAPRG